MTESFVAWCLLVMFIISALSSNIIIIHHLDAGQAFGITKIEKEDFLNIFKVNPQAFNVTNSDKVIGTAVERTEKYNLMDSSFLVEEKTFRLNEVPHNMQWLVDKNILDSKKIKPQFDLLLKEIENEGYGEINYVSAYSLVKVEFSKDEVFEGTISLESFNKLKKILDDFPKLVAFCNTLESIYGELKS